MTTENPFSGIFLDALQTGKSQKSSQNEAEYVEKLLGFFDESHAGARLLDVPCGNGRIALELAAKGYRVTGLDLSRSLLESARQAAAERGLAERTEWLEGDMRELPGPDLFDGAYCFWESFGYFDDAGNQAFLNAAARALRPGARFVLDTHVVETLLPRIHVRDWTPLRDLIVLEERGYDVHTGIVTRHWVFIENGKIEERQLETRLYLYKELTAMLAAAGFDDIQGYDFMTAKPFDLGASRLVITAQRAAAQGGAG